MWIMRSSRVNWSWYGKKGIVASTGTLSVIEERKGEPYQNISNFQSQGGDSHQ